LESTNSHRHPSSRRRARDEAGCHKESTLKNRKLKGKAWRQKSLRDKFEASLEATRKKNAKFPVSEGGIQTRGTPLNLKRIGPITVHYLKPKGGRESRVRKGAREGASMTCFFCGDVWDLEIIKGWVRVSARLEGVSKRNPAKHGTKEDRKRRGGLC